MRVGTPGRGFGRASRRGWLRRPSPGCWPRRPAFPRGPKEGTSCLPSVLWERPAFAANNLGWAAAASLAWMPYQILSLGFQLSFAATFFLILYSHPMAMLLKRLRIGGALAAYCVSTPMLS